ncbi:MAG: hypothetical protein AAF320_01125 [Myxococcota bacterium]
MISQTVAPWQTGFCLGKRGVTHEQYEHQQWDFYIHTIPNIVPQNPTVFPIALLSAWPRHTDRLPHLEDPCRQQDLVQHFEQQAQRCQQQGWPAAAIEADEDSLLHALLSPRTSPLSTHEDRVSLLLKICQAVHQHISVWGVTLLVEELCPGGLDPLAGQKIALAIQKAGSHFIVASAGTKDFPALKWRRATKKKQEDPDRTQQTPPVWLASSLWLRHLPQLTIPVLAQSPHAVHTDALQQAKKTGLQGVVVCNV